MPVQRRTSTPRSRRRPPRVAGRPPSRSSGADVGAEPTPVRSEQEYPTEVFGPARDQHSVRDQAAEADGKAAEGRDEVRRDGTERPPTKAGPAAGAEEVEPPQVIDAVRAEPVDVCTQLFGRHPGSEEEVDTAVIPQLAVIPQVAAADVPTGVDEASTELIPVYRPTPPRDDPGPARPISAAAGAPAETPPGAPAETAVDTSVEASVDAPTGEAACVDPAPTEPAAPRSRRPVPLVLALLVVALAGAAGAWYFAQQAGKPGPAQPTSNLALIDRAATTQVVEQVSKAVEAIYSYDSTALDASESRAMSFVTGSFSEEFKRNFNSVRQFGPQQRVSLTSKVVAAGAETLTDRRATLLLLVDQEGRRGDSQQPLKASVRLNVTAQRVDGQWKVSGVNQK